MGLWGRSNIALSFLKTSIRLWSSGKEDRSEGWLTSGNESEEVAVIVSNLPNRRDSNLLFYCKFINQYVDCAFPTMNSKGSEECQVKQM